MNDGVAFKSRRSFVFKKGKKQAVCTFVDVICVVHIIVVVVVVTTTATTITIVVVVVVVIVMYIIICAFCSCWRITCAGNADLLMLRKVIARQQSVLPLSKPCRSAESAQGNLLWS